MPQPIPLVTFEEPNPPGELRMHWRVHLETAPAEVYRFLSTAEGRKRFWAESAEQTGSEIEFRFPDGTVLRSRVLDAVAPERFRLTYFGGSTVTFQLEGDGQGGTDVSLSEEGLQPEHFKENERGWVSVLLCLKAAADFGVDLRNHDQTRAWGARYVDS
jgi:uncharacterized protein YndB with AHSA1/START domain